MKRWQRSGAGFLILVATPVLLNGCVSGLERGKARWPVDISPMDTVEFLYHGGSGDDTPGERLVRITLSGSGYLACQAGRSERVNSGFWKESANDSWHDFRTDQLVLTAEETSRYFQRVVDAGLFAVDSRAQPGRDEEDTSVRLVIRAVVDGRKQTTVAVDPALMGVFRELLAKF